MHVLECRWFASREHVALPSQNKTNSATAFARPIMQLHTPDFHAGSLYSLRSYLLQMPKACPARLHSKVDNFNPLRAVPLSCDGNAAKAPILIAAILSFLRCFSSPSGQRWQYSQASAFWHPLGFHIHAHGRHCPCS